MVEINFFKIEKKWQDRWSKEKTFEVKEDSKKKKYYTLEMFPYPSGEGIHMGHTFNFTLVDILARFKRLSGLNVMYPVGYDSLGLPAENAAIKVGTHPKEYTDKSIPNFMKQQKALGLSYDWSRVISTADPEYYKWDQWVFLEMFKKSLAYQKTRAVNWCPSCKTVLANEQAQSGTCDRCETPVKIKHLKQWFFKITDYADELYENIDKLDWPEKTKAMQRNWIGKSHGTQIDFEINKKPWPIFTTRPDTIFGVTFMVISAQHEGLMSLVTKEQKKEVENFLNKLGSVSEKDLAEMDKLGAFTGSYAINPANKEKVPIYVGNFVIADYGSGMVMAVPAHDQRDFEFAKKYKIKIKPVVLKEHNESYSYVMGINEKDIAKIGIKIIEKTEEGFFKIKIPFGKLEEYKSFIRKNLQPGFWNEFSTPKGFYFIFKHKNKKLEEFELNEKTNDLIDNYGMTFNNEKPKKNPENVYSWLAENDFYKELLIHTDTGTLISSGKFNGLDNKEAINQITKEFGKKIVQFKLRDWGISRQRYWGTPIPIIHCEKCGTVPVPEKDLPVILPEKVKFGEGNPLETAKDWVNVSCPKCKGKAKRETDTMDTFVNSSWYFFRYCDTQNKKEIFDKNKVNYWCPIDTYIGGAEHSCMHLIYSRFYTKFLNDMGLLNFREPIKRLFHQGMINDEKGQKQSKSKGNVVEPLKLIQEYGSDTLRFFITSVAAPDKGFNWSTKGIQGSSKLIKRIINYFEESKEEKDSPEVLNKLNKTISNVESYYENFQYRKATIEIRELFDLIEKNPASKETKERFLQILNPICPHITEELWNRLGNKNLISTSEWPKAGKVTDKKSESNLDETVIRDINYFLEKTPTKPKKIYLYAMHFEIKKINKEKISKKVGLPIDVFAVNDKNKYDPQGKAGKAKPGKPSIFLE
ncbi:MAG: leucine--tRNA ligase [archaeon]|nr:leucine--tRNA ligase [archaeon]MCR4323449.1 leucine--tRNA ligase [Nanoarchaeota archaeon]